MLWLLSHINMIHWALEHVEMGWDRCCRSVPDYSSRSNKQTGFHLSTCAVHMLNYAALHTHSRLIDGCFPSPNLTDTTLHLWLCQCWPPFYLSDPPRYTSLRSPILVFIFLSPSVYVCIAFLLHDHFWPSPVLGLSWLIIIKVEDGHPSSRYGDGSICWNKTLDSSI